MHDSPIKRCFALISPRRADTSESNPRDAGRIRRHWSRGCAQAPMSRRSVETIRSRAQRMHDSPNKRCFAEIPRRLDDSRIKSPRDAALPPTLASHLRALAPFSAAPRSSGLATQRMHDSPIKAGRDASRASPRSCTSTLRDSRQPPSSRAVVLMRWRRRRMSEHNGSRSLVVAARAPVRVANARRSARVCRTKRDLVSPRGTRCW
jgi:hypothetical protein